MFDSATMLLRVDPLIRSALEEDITSEDISTACIMQEPTCGEADLLCKQDGVLCGLQVFARVFTMLDPKSCFTALAKDGDDIRAGQKLGVIRGDLRALLSGERTALNYLQRMSGVATHARRAAKLLDGTGIHLLDTRKTTPNNRIFEKYAVRCGGGQNHRYNLSDAVMLKDNHISAAGGIQPAVAAARAYISFVTKIEVEVENLDMVREAVEAGADIIMLDNMDIETMRAAADIIGGRAVIEISGNVTEERIAALRDLPVQYISSGALTHSSPILDLSLKNMRRVG